MLGWRFLPWTPCTEDGADMANGQTHWKRPGLFWLVAMVGLLIPVPLASLVQAQEEPRPTAPGGFPNGGFLGGNPFGPSLEEREKRKQNTGDWSYRPRNVDKYLSEAASWARRGNYETAL